MSAKNIYKKNCRSIFFKVLSTLGRKANFIYENRNYRSESNGEDVVLNKLRSHKINIIFDVGANIGNWSKSASKVFSNSQIYAFEPIIQNFEKLSELKLKNVHSYNFGLGDKNHEIEFNLYENSHELCSQFDFSMHSEVPRKTKVSILEGKKFCQENDITNIDFLKIDTEGADLNVIEGFEDLLKNNKIRVIQFEYGRINIVSKDLLFDFYQYLSKFNYRIGKIYPKNVEFRDYKYEHEDFIGPNFIAVKSDEQEIINTLSKS